MLEPTTFRNSNTSRECADEIVDIGRMVDHEGIPVAISSLTARADDNELDKRVKEVNKILKKFCRQNKWGFIDHNNITTDQDLNRSRLHLTFEQKWNLSFESEFYFIY